MIKLFSLIFNLCLGGNDFTVARDFIQNLAQRFTINLLLLSNELSGIALII